jgi:hypothetical protein
MAAVGFNVGLAVGWRAGRLVRMRESGQIIRPAATQNARPSRQTRGQAIA